MIDSLIERIEAGLDAAARVLEGYPMETIEARRKSGGDPVTEADLAVDRAMRELLPDEGEGWLSEETRDDLSRLERSRLWVVDPIDGTKEFVTGIPEWCVSIGYVVDGVAVAGGILNPLAGHRVVGGRGVGVRLNGEPALVREPRLLAGAGILASRSEIKRGEWERFEGASFEVVPMGSVAYKLARVAAGLSDATWTLVPKSEWDVAAGVALVEAAGGVVRLPEGGVPRFNRRDVRLPGLLAAGPSLMGEIEERLDLPR